MTGPGCLSARRGLELGHVLPLEHSLSLRLRDFSLVQGNHPGNPERTHPGWSLSHQPAGEGSDAVIRRAAENTLDPGHLAADL